MCPVCSFARTTSFSDLYLRCPFCQSLYLKKLPNKKTRQKIIDKEADRIILSGINKKIANIHKDRLSYFLKKTAFKGNKVLDIGCGQGVFLQYVKKFGYVSYAFDKSEKIIDFIKRSGVFGFKSFNTIPPVFFKLITFFDVIEHTVSPGQFLRKVKGKLKNNGFIMLTTPNAWGVSARLLRHKWHVLDPRRHYLLFSPKGLILLLEECGFEVLDIKTDIFTPWLVQGDERLKKVVNKIVYLGLSLGQNYLFSHNLGDNIQVIARLKDLKSSPGVC